MHAVPPDSAEPPSTNHLTSHLLEGGWLGQASPKAVRRSISLECNCAIFGGSKTCHILQPRSKPATHESSFPGLCGTIPNVLEEVSRYRSAGHGMTEELIAENEMSGFQNPRVQMSECPAVQRCHTHRFFRHNSPTFTGTPTEPELASWLASYALLCKATGRMMNALQLSDGRSPM